jgi:hypothetical protein
MNLVATRMIDMLDIVVETSLMNSNIHYKRNDDNLFEPVMVRIIVPSTSEQNLKFGLTHVQVEE